MFNYVFVVCVVWVYVCKFRYPQRPEVSDTPEMELQTMMRQGLKPFGRTEGALNC